MKRLLFLGLMCLSAAAFSQTPILLIGTYTSKSTSTGLYSYRFDTASGALTVIDSAATSNPSFLVPSKNGRFVYAVNEDAPGGVSAFGLDKGRFRFLNRQSSLGDHPCTITLDENRAQVIVGNYSSGNGALLPIRADGSLGAATDSFRHKGSGPDKGRQAGPHVHAAVLAPDNRYAYVADLGTDQLTAYRLYEKRVSMAYRVRMRPGSGPRLLAFHPNGRWAYLVQEMAGNVSLIEMERPRMTPRQTVSLLPEGTAAGTSAHVAVSPDGRFLYASNRKPTNTIAVFGIDQRSGRLTLVGQQASGGLVPRFFTIDPSGNWLLAANQDSDNIALFRIDRATGRLTDMGKRVSVPRPVCLQWTR